MKSYLFICANESCEKVSKGFWHVDRHGVPRKAKYCSVLCLSTVMRDPQIISKRFWGKVNICKHGKTCMDCCWPWGASLDADNRYGQFMFRREGRQLKIPSHVFSFRERFGDVPSGYVICHKCDVPSCCNFYHLFSGTNAENSADMVRKNRQAYGARNGRAKLTDGDVLRIREHHKLGVSPKVQALDYGVSRVLIYKVIDGTLWKHIR